jgi:aspartyl-tRNA(Asn)/glutamyl-tRNA(Gln) amidotransferase subunit A
MTDILSKAATASEIARAVMSGKAKASAVIDAALNRIEAAEPTVNAFTDIVAARARRRAAQIDTGRHLGPLMGVPFAVKNLFDIQGLPTRAGSKINVDGPIARRDGALVRKLEAAGAILVGGLNMGEYAYDFTGENAHYGASRNPAARRAARARRSRRARCRWRWAPTPTARSACRRRCAACSD